MPRSISPTELRSSIYKVIDEVLATGEPIIIVRRGKRLVLAPEEGRRFSIDDLPERTATRLSPDELVETTWEHTWEPEP